MAPPRGSRSGSIRNRLLFGTTAIAIIPLVLLAVVLSYFASQQVESALNQRALSQLQSIRVAKSAEIQAYFNSVADDITIAAKSADVQIALTQLPAAYQLLPQHLPISQAEAKAELNTFYRKVFGERFSERNASTKYNTDAVLNLQSEAAVAAQYLYIASNPNPLGDKGKLDQAEGDTSEYSQLHGKIHQFGRAVVERYSLYDVFLVDMQGNVVYTYFKEIDFGTNLLSGPWADSGLGEAFANASDESVGEVRITDYADYVPSYNDKASFVSTPVYDGATQIGVFIAQLPIARVNSIMTFDSKWAGVGLGESGEVYLVGQDKTPRSISRFLIEDPAGFFAVLKGLGLPADALTSMTTQSTNVGLMSIDTLGVTEALAGKAANAVYPDYRGVAVLGAYSPIQVLNLTWAILSEIDESEARAPVLELRTQLAWVAVIALLIMAAIAAFTALRLARTINVPLAHFGKVVASVASGDNAVRVNLPPRDEIGELATAFDRMIDERNAVQAGIEKENNDLNNSVVEIMTSVAQLASRNLTVKVPVSENVTGAVSDAINMMTRSTAGALKNVRRISNAVSVASLSVQRRSQQVHVVAEGASTQATSASAELQQTAMALREMGEQARNATKQAAIAIKSSVDAMDIVRATVTGISESRDQIRETEKRVKRLGERSQEISGVVNIIGQIAERTSVLALNASMQAVAAGDAGRGFAVVADEVKRLAENARQATQQIGTLVNAIQADTVETIQAMNGTIAQVVDISRLADRAGGQMNDNRAATEDLAEAVRSIAASTQAQSDASKTLLTRAYELLQSSQRTVEELDAQRADTDALADSALQLVSTVEEFTLPA